MIYQLNKNEDKFLENVYDEAMKELGSFYEINWVHNKPRVILVNSRKMINDLFERETENWLLGWSEGRNIFLLDNDAMETESSHKKNSVEDYACIIKHELSHSFFGIVSKVQVGYRPKWLLEGVAIYTSGEQKKRKRPEKFGSFLDFFDAEGNGVYKESGFAVELLINKFGKQKLFELIKAQKDIKTRDDFDGKFYEIYGFDPSYEEFNKIV